VTNYAVTQNQIHQAVAEEVARARDLFPSNEDLLLAFAEEAGEVVKAFMDLKQKGAPAWSVAKELVQVMAMAHRLLQEGDPAFPGYQPAPGFMSKN
jgi:NTP pyrophosphatase (non-canonical NTP hydrolase)